MTRPVHPAYVVSADWSKHARKRSVYIADLQQRRIRRAEGHAWHLASLLTLATDLARHGSVLVGIDLALGVPRDYWRRVRDGRRRRQPVTFLDWLCELDPTSGFFQTTDDPHRWRVERPWFAVPPGHGGLRSFTAQAGDGFRRRLDHATQAKPLFAVSGMPGTVGSGTRDFWKALIPVLARKRDFAIWPFEGELPDLFATQQIVLAETYPALAYAVALATDLPTHRVRVAKTHHAARDRVCGHLAQMPWVVANGVDLGDLGPTITTEAPDVMWGTDMTTTVTVSEGAACVFVAVDHCTTECIGLHAATRGTRFEALEPIRQGVRERFGEIGDGVARGLRRRHDHGSNYLADDFQQEVAFFGIESSPSFVREPEGNGVAERFIRTLKENLLWVRSFDTIEALRLALLAFKRTYNEQWMLEKYHYRSPAQVRRDLVGLDAAA